MDIEDYEGLYQISDHGRAKSLERIVRHWRGGFRVVKEKILKQSLNGPVHRQYYAVGLWKNGTLKTMKIHRLVALYFVPNPNNLPEVNHDDNNPLNNHYTNLGWITNRDNRNHGMAFKETSSKYPGVSWDKQRNKWRTQIQEKGKKKNLGCFCSELEAASIYQNALKLLLE